MSLIAFDGWNIVRRVHGAIQNDNARDRARQAFKNSSATFGRAMRRFAPSYGVVAWDHSAPTWRRQAYAGYKAEREPMPAELRNEIDTFQSVLWDRFGMPSVSIAGVEAGDVIATLAKRWSAGRGEGPCIVVSTDKVLASLASDRVTVFNVFEDEIRDCDWCADKFGVPPSCLLDLLAMQGDKANGIPGVPGIGPKKGRALMEDYGSLEAIMRAAPSVEGSLGRYLVDGAELAALSRLLVEPKIDVTLGLSWSQLRLSTRSRGAAAANATASTTQQRSTR